MALRSKTECPCGCGEPVSTRDDAVRAYQRILDGWADMLAFEESCSDLMRSESVAVLRRSISRSKADLEAHMHGTAKPTMHPDITHIDKEVTFWESRWSEYLSDAEAPSYG